MKIRIGFNGSFGGLLYSSGKASALSSGIQINDGRASGWLGLAGQRPGSAAA